MTTLLQNSGAVHFSFWLLKLFPCLCLTCSRTIFSFLHEGLCPLCEDSCLGLACPGNSQGKQA